MLIQHHTIAAHYVGVALQGAIRRGLDPVPLLAQAGLEADLPARLPPLQYAELVKAVWRTMDDEFLGLTTRPCPVGAFALMSELVIHAATLGEALDKCSRFYRIANDSLALGVTVENGQAFLWMRLQDPSRDADHFLLEFMLVMWSRLAGWLVRERIHLQGAHFIHETPAHVREYPTLFPCPLLFSQTRNALVFDAGWLQRPVKRSPAELKALLPTLPGAFLVKPVFHGSYTQRVRELIAEDMATGFPDLEAVAQHFWMTGRTLRRKLLREDSHYQDIKDDIRREQAVQWLAQGELSLQEIAQQLGFAEASAFIRAFKLWTGLTPGQYIATAAKTTP
ncbi:MAG: AraC family transcriptional regulator [Fluviicoccus sp.]|uniref:AraC family transcriptional regulator n=1 Tax=Fluviicoccus sp. TaxID=2003552 RepID=UPI0027233F7A|nr:AraC family transcriptional regulator [Fluviicoccus sp.]MDO8331006.1 AraC family transcriptional regulator [Fluviicoccus sp.]